MSTAGRWVGGMIALTACSVVWASDPAAEAAYAQGRQAYRADRHERAMDLLLPLARAGHAGAQYYIGRMYEKGEGVASDPEQTVNWYRRSAEGGDPRAQYKLAAGYAQGWGRLEQDDVLAREWLLKAAEGGYHRAQRALGEAYKRGRLGLPADPAKAEYWLTRANEGKGG